MLVVFMSRIKIQRQILGGYKKGKNQVEWIGINNKKTMLLADISMIKASALQAYRNEFRTSELT